MIHVLLDTSIFRQDPSRKKVAFQALIKLGKSGRVKVYIPYFVQQEFLSQQTTDYSNQVIAAHELINLR